MSTEPARRYVHRFTVAAPIYRDDRWHNLAALAFDVWPRRGSGWETWRHRLVRWLLPAVAAVLDEQATAETRYLMDGRG